MAEAVVHIYNRACLSHKNEHIWVSPNEVHEPKPVIQSEVREKQVSYINAYIRNLERWWAIYFLKIFAEHRAWRNKCTVWLYRGAFILTGNPQITPVVGDDKAWKTPVSTSPRGFRENDVWRAAHEEGGVGGSLLNRGCRPPAGVVIWGGLKDWYALQAAPEKMGMKGLEILPLGT